MDDRLAERQRAWRAWLLHHVRHHDRRMREAAEGAPRDIFKRLRFEAKRLRGRIEAWLYADESDLDAKAARQGLGEHP